MCPCVVRADGRQEEACADDGVEVCIDTVAMLTIGATQWSMCQMGKITGDINVGWPIILLLMACWKALTRMMP